jgi:peptide/nickel transport system permease protein
MNHLALILYRLGKTLAQALTIIVLVFFLTRVVPGDAVDVLNAEGNLTEAQAESLRGELGLDRPVHLQFVDWAGAALHGDFGTSLRFQQPVSHMLMSALPTTLALAGFGFVVGIVISFGVAIAAVMSRRSVFAGVVDLLNIWSISIPTFCAGVLAILVFSVWLGWVPILGNLLFPILILGIDKAGQIAKPLYEELSESSTAAHVRTARAKGLSPFRVAVFHLLPTGVPVALAMSGLVLASLVAGTLTMEVLFGLPGVGSLMLNAIHGRDYPVIQATIVVIAVALVLINATMDLLHRAVDPRVA